jgi:macrolide transport system ATP-binding/permease protein
VPLPFRDVPSFLPSDAAALAADDVSRTYPTSRDGRPTLDGVDLVASPGTRVGLIGENGSGKSTLLRILAGQDRPDSGSVRAPADLVLVPQEPELSGHATVGSLLDAALEPLHRAVTRLERLAEALADHSHDSAARTADDYDHTLAWVRLHDAWDVDRRAEVTAGALGVADLSRDRPVSTLSGGQRTRLALTAALVRRPACLLLDEPTNHLDEEALELVERSLAALPGVVVAASHDRTFLDRVCTELVDLDAGELGTDGRGGRRFGGGYTAYLAHRAESRGRWQQLYDDQQEEIARLEGQTRLDTRAVAKGRGPRDNDKFVHAFKGANVERTHARRVRDARRRLDTARRGAVERPPPPLRFSAGLTGVPRGPETAVQVRGLQVDGRHGDGPRVRVGRLDVPTGGRLLVTGRNGSGKSTLLGVIAGRVQPDHGTVQVSARTVGLLPQDPDLGDPSLSAEQLYRRGVGPERAEQLPLASLGLLHPRDASTALGRLSLGQRRRLALAVVVATSPDLLLLDEPSNHISLSLVAELEEAWTTAPGTVVVTSHDRWLTTRWDGATYALT